MVTVLACWRLSSVSMSGAVSVGKAAGRRGREGAPTGRLEGHRTGKMLGEMFCCRVCILQPSGSRAGKGGVGRRLITTLHMERLATGSPRRLLELIQRVPGGRGGRQGRARYGRGGSRCAGGEASIPGQSTSTRTGRNVSTCARRGESEISAVAGGGGEGGRATRQAEEAGSRKVEAGGSRNQAGWTGDATGMKVNPGVDGLRKAGARGSFIGARG